MVVVFFLPGVKVISSDMNMVSICSMQILHWGPTRFKAWPVFYFPYIPTLLVRLYPHIFIPLCWRYPTQTLLSFIKHLYFCSDFCHGHETVNDTGRLFTLIMCPFVSIIKFYTQPPHQAFYTLKLCPLILVRLKFLDETQ